MEKTARITDKEKPKRLIEHNNGKPMVIGAKPKRNEPCRCGSGKKYKSCHWSQDQKHVTGFLKPKK